MDCDITYTYDSHNNRREMRTGNKVTAYRYSLNDELLRTDTLNMVTNRDVVTVYKYDKNGNELATVNRHDIPDGYSLGVYLDIDVTLGNNRFNDNAVNHYDAENRLIGTITKDYKVGYAMDPHGSTAQLVDETGKITKTYEYDSFGNEIKPDKKDENPFRYCGEYYDKETEEVYLRARYYQPGLGRFLASESDI